MHQTSRIYHVKDEMCVSSESAPFVKGVRVIVAGSAGQGLSFSGWCFSEGRLRASGLIGLAELVQEKGGGRGWILHEGGHEFWIGELFLLPE